MSPTAILIILVVIILGWITISYNKFIQLINQTHEAWADINVQLKRRYDLIPNLVDLVKAYAKHEKELLTELTKIRSQAMESKTVEEKGETNLKMGTFLNKILAVAENYPQLRANENFLKLQDELGNTENTLASARRFYNGNVRDLNTLIETFPNNLLATLFKFQKREFFQLEKEESKTPQVS